LLASLDGAFDLFVVSEAEDGPGHRIKGTSEAGFADLANRGLAAARQAGHSTALLCNDDIRFLPGALSLLRTAIATEGVGVAGPLVLDWEGPRVQQAGIAVSLRSGRIRELSAPADEAQAISGAAMALDLACWEQLGGFDERYSFYFEDIDFCLRARAAGWTVRLVEDAQVRHRGGGTRTRRSPEAAWHLGRSHALFCRDLPGSAAARAGRLLWSGTAGLGWSLRASGLAGARGFARGWAEGLKA
jgi:GT2 family glycosyltransferase